MKKQDFYYPSQDGTTQIHAIEWIPDKAPSAILQICHGMVEYIGRYDAFAAFLAEHGFYVTGNDHLGHGASVTTDAQHGFFHDPNGNECVIGDIHTLREMTAARLPGVPYFLMGHSMGSFLARQYIELYGTGLSGAIIMGTGTQPELVLTAGMFLCERIAKAKGWDYRSQTVNNIAFGSYNKKFQPARTPQDWLTKDTQVVDAYRKDPWCTFLFTVNAYYHMFRGIQLMQKPENIKKIPRDLPLFLVSGADDPVGGFGKGVEAAFQGYHKAGLRDVQMKLYPKDRHEILNELDKAQVFQDLLDWLMAHV